MRATEAQTGLPDLDGWAVLEHWEDPGGILLVDEVADAGADGDVTLEEVDTRPGAFAAIRSVPGSGGEAVEHVLTRYESVRDARLAAGVWLEAGPFTDPEHGRAVPLKVAAAGRRCLAAYLRLGGSGELRPREWVGEQLEVTPLTVSEYCSDVRWAPGSEE